MRYRLQRHDGTDCSATMVPITVLRMVPIQRYRQQGGSFDKRKFGNAERVKVILQMKAKGRAIRRVYFLQRIVRGVETKKPNQKTDSVCGAYGTLTYNFTKYHKLVTIY